MTYLAMIIAKPEIRAQFLDLHLEFEGKSVIFDRKIEILGFIINEDSELNDFVNETVKKFDSRLAILRKLKISSLETRKNISVSLILN